eukprot:Colp12_sorted_trinity150504_noHs@9695
MQSGAVFARFHEQPLTFKPTYKYDRGCRVYAEELQRIPSWCDRILWTSHPGCPIRPLHYSCCNAITTSDHSPVSGSFAVGLQHVGRFSEGWDDYQPHHDRRFNLVFPEGLRLSCSSSAVEAPLLRFCGAYSGLKTKTAAANKGGTFEWGQYDVPVLAPPVHEPAYLRGEALHMVVYDKRVGLARIGQVLLPVGNALEDPVPFEVPVTKGGRVVGTLTGVIHVSQYLDESFYCQPDPHDSVAVLSSLHTVSLSSPPSPTATPRNNPGLRSRLFSKLRRDSRDKGLDGSNSSGLSHSTSSTGPPRRKKKDKLEGTRSESVIGSTTDLQASDFDDPAAYWLYDEWAANPSGNGT